MVYLAGAYSLYTPPIPSPAVFAPPPPIFVPATSYGPPTPVRAPPVTPFGVPTPPLSLTGPSPEHLLGGIITFRPTSVGPFSAPAGIAAAPPPSIFFPFERPTPPQPFSVPAGIAAAPPPSNFFPSERPTPPRPFFVPAGTVAAPPPSNFFPFERPTPPQPFSVPAGIAAAPPPSNFLPLVSPPPIRAQSAPTGITSAPPKELVLPPGSRIEIRDERGQYSHGGSPSLELPSFLSSGSSCLTPWSWMDIYTIHLGILPKLTANSNQRTLSPNLAHLRDSTEMPVRSATFSDQNGTTVSEQGRLTLTNEGWESVIVKEGSYSYVSPEGIPVSVSYIADENGFRATGSHLPKVVLAKGR
uniref:Uncharacterized protein n=1 Tax=Timema douglasi TaxID=61478 RepID=A0A7R8VWJ6_TIMDO|nr:unnamed protein product [Timema douglasi]